MDKANNRRVKWSIDSQCFMVFGVVTMILRNCSFFHLLRMSEKIKICVVGERNAGKTIFCNLIAGQFSDPAQLLEHRRPTASLRGLEFEHEIDSKTRIDVELWDCSGDPEQGENTLLITFYNILQKRFGRHFDTHAEASLFSHEIRASNRSLITLLKAELCSLNRVCFG